MIGAAAALLSFSSNQGYQIGRSARTRRAVLAYFGRTPGGAGNRKTWTWSAWVKRGKLATTQGLFGAYGASNDGGASAIVIDATDKLVVRGFSTVWRQTSRVFRDTTGWTHIVVAMDTSQATAADRIRVYVNGAEETSFSTSADPSLNADLGINQAVAHSVGSWEPYATTGFSTHDGFVAEVVFVDGLALGPTSFGRSNQIYGYWEPVGYSGAYGTNGFRLDFSDNSAATSAAIGKDRSGNNNDWTPNNISITAGITNDSFIDSPTNYNDSGTGRGNYPTFDEAGSFSVDEGGLKANPNGGSLVGGCVAPFPIRSGKWYNEFVYVSGAAVFGLAILGENLINNGRIPGYRPGSYGFDYLGRKVNNSTPTAYGSAPSANDIIGQAIDADSGKVWWSVNGVWQASGDPAAGTNAAFTGLVFNAEYDYVPACGSASAGSVVHLNAGQRPFNYTPPTGFKALNSYNLPAVAVRQRSAGYVSVAALGSAVETDLAAARASWGGDAYFEVFKNRSNSESWKWRFSDDSGNMLSSDSTAARTSFTTPVSGDGYLGMAFRAIAANGIFTGTVAHTNGVASTLAHGLGAGRKMAIVKSAITATTNWFVSHPDLSAGKLITLNTQAAEATDASITIDNTNVTLAAALATGTYRVIVFRETEGFISLSNYTGRAITDNAPIPTAGVAACLWFLQKIYNGGNFLLDRATSPFNVRASGLSINLANAENGFAVATDTDFRATSAKLRSSAAAIGSANQFVTMTIIDQPMKYARAQ